MCSGEWQSCQNVQICWWRTYCWRQSSVSGTGRQSSILPPHIREFCSDQTFPARDQRWYVWNVQFYQPKQKGYNGNFFGGRGGGNFPRFNWFWIGLIGQMLGNHNFSYPYLLKSIWMLIFFSVISCCAINLHKVWKSKKKKSKRTNKIIYALMPHLLFNTTWTWFLKGSIFVVVERFISVMVHIYFMKCIFKNQQHIGDLATLYMWKFWCIVLQFII